MNITDSGHLVFNDEQGKTQCITKEEILKMCANYERDNVDPIVEQVKEKLSSRSSVGIKKYKTTIFDNTDENYMQHLQDELLDGANYCQQMIRLGKFSMNVSKILDTETNYYTIGELVSKEYKKLKNDNN